MKLCGVIPPVVMPATDDGMCVDGPRLRQLTSSLIEAGVNGVFVGATAGEATMLDRKQRQVAIEAAVSEADKRVPVIAGASAASTAEALKYARDAQDGGADFIMLLPPGVFPLSEEELIRHFRTVADSVTIPSLLYNFPRIAAGQKISARVAGEVCRQSQFVGIKDSSGEIANARLYRLECGDEFALLIGADSLVYPHLLLGGDGMVCAGVTLFPKLHVALYKAHQAGDHKRALALQDALLLVADLCGIGVFPASLKTALAFLGIEIGPPFLPVLPLSQEQAAQAKNIVTRIQEATRELVTR